MMLSLTLALVTAVPALPPGGVDRSLVIVTTERIRTGSARLADFVRAKERRGFAVRVATEVDHGGAELRGQERAERIRGFLQSVQAQYSFALLIGPAHAEFGEVPLWWVCPRHAYAPDNCGGFALDCRCHETDHLYADLTGDWDLSGNGQLGETDLDEGPGGIDIVPELYVGRIPFFFDDLRELDRILDAAMRYQDEAPDQLAYRSRVLLPAAFYYFEGQQLVGYTFPTDVDGADNAEWFRHQLAGDHPGVTATRLYEREGHVTSRHESDLALTEENLVSEWAEGYGMVFWFGHGLEREVARTVWDADRDGSGRASSDELSQPLFIRSADAERIGGAHGAFVVAVSCEVGSVNVPDALAHRLLVEGAAVGMIASTSVTPGSYTDYPDPGSPLDTTTTGADNVGIVFLGALLRGEPAGKAFFDAKVALGAERSVESLAGRTMLNYLGDPTLGLAASSADVVAPEPPDDATPLDDGDTGCSTTGADPTGMLPLIVLLVAVPLRRCWRARRRSYSGDAPRDAGRA